MKIAILADIHANIYAFNEVLADIQKESVDKIIVAGDLVGYDKPTYIEPVIGTKIYRGNTEYIVELN